MLADASTPVEVDGVAIATTDDTPHVPVASLVDGTHRWRVVAVDRRGGRYMVRLRVSDQREPWSEPT